MFPPASRINPKYLNLYYNFRVNNYVRPKEVPLPLPKQNCCLLSGNGKPSQFLCKWRIISSDSVLKLSVQEPCGTVLQVLSKD